MENAADAWAVIPEGGSGPVLCEDADTNYKLRLEDFDGTPQSRVADLEEGLPFIVRQLVRRQVSAARLEELEGAVIAHEERVEECIWSREHRLSPAPEPTTGDLAALAGQPEHGSFGVLMDRPPNLCLDSEPVANNGNLAKRNSGLGHAPGPRVHSKQKNLLEPTTVSAEILRMRLTGIVQGVVDIAHRRSEAELRNIRAQLICNYFEVGDGHPLGFYIGGVAAMELSITRRGRFVIALT